MTFNKPALVRITAFSGVILVLMLLASASQLMLSTSFLGQPMPWRLALKSAWMENYPWLLLVPAILALCWRFPLTPAHWRSRLVLHAAGALLTAASYAVLHDQKDDQFFFFQTAPPDARTSVDAAPIVRRMAPVTWLDRVRATFLNRGVFQMATYLVVVVAWEGMEAQRRSRQREKQAAELARQLAEARLKFLHTQLRPHFLFNTLNAITSLLRDQPDASEAMIVHLSELLRLSLDHDQVPLISLERELQLLDSYLAIEQIRFGDRLAISRAIDPKALAAQVPALLLQPLAENSIRHGLEPKPGPGQLTVEAVREAASLRIRIADTGCGLKKHSPDPVGLGISNTRTRLREVYGSDHTFRIGDRPGGGTEVEIVIPWRAPLASAT